MKPSTNKTTPKVSVLMSVYNGADFLDESIESILKQTFNDFEFIIIDDGSTDESYEIIQSYANKNRQIVVIQNKNRIHLTKSLNNGLKIAKGKYIARQDADDISLPERLQTQITYMENNEDIGILGTSVELIDVKSKNIRTIKGQSNTNFLKWHLLLSNPLIHSSVMLRSELITSNGGYDNTFIKSQDYALWSKLSKISKITQLPNVLVKRRIKYTSFETEQFNTSVGIMHSNIKTFLQKNIPLHHCKLLRFIKYSPLKNREEYNIAFTLLLELKNAYLTDKNLDDETIRLIETDVNKIIDKWKKYPTFNYFLPKPIMYMETIFIRWIQGQTQRRTRVGMVFSILKKLITKSNNNFAN